MYTEDRRRSQCVGLQIYQLLLVIGTQHSLEMVDARTYSYG